MISGFCLGSGKCLVERLSGRVIDGAPSNAYRMLDCQGRRMARACKAVVGELFRVGFLLGCLGGIGKSAHLVKWRLSGRLHRRLTRGQHMAIEGVGRLGERNRCMLRLGGQVVG